MHSAGPIYCEPVPLNLVLFTEILARNCGATMKSARICIPVDPKATFFNQRAISWKKADALFINMSQVYGYSDSG